jgi:hypothetical protein
MRKGAHMPRYRCSRCSREWARRGGFRDCPDCGARPPEGGHRLVAFGWDGTVQQFGAVLPQKRRNP